MPPTLRKESIGPEVAQLQRQLIALGLAITITAHYDTATEAAVKTFQARAGLVVDGIAGPKTQDLLMRGERDKKLLSERDLERAADRLKCEVAAIKAVNEVESRGGGFLPDGRCKILFERHVMYHQLGEAAERHATQCPAIVNSKRGGYVGGPAEYGRLALAAQIDHAAAHESCSWGQYQIMGHHWQKLGYPSIDAFVADMQTSEAKHLDAFCRFIEINPGIHKALQAKKWEAFARGYNGPAYKDNLYDAKLARAYARHKETPNG